MPIEVRELVIKARVEEIPRSSAAGNGATGRSGTLSESELQTIIALCAEEVLKIIKKQKER
ncbi:DUF5908 family protein [Chitinophaga japonensis]|uniref:Uncharacterized protein n=1 Tax=Chitinophaga japonensis TaxID=104662 RepID=A0A562T1G5_CHIJA|nr:DUF5908 family protein [Chitinophaga japonensis]TWI87018.1 hypothetical protein LX66_4286 [Chitinophaga japonensis]